MASIDFDELGSIPVGDLKKSLNVIFEIIDYYKKISEIPCRVSKPDGNNEGEVRMHNEFCRELERIKKDLERDMAHQCILIRYNVSR